MTVQGPVKNQRPDGLPHGGGGWRRPERRWGAMPPCRGVEGADLWSEVCARTSLPARLPH